MVQGTRIKNKVLNINANLEELLVLTQSGDAIT
jgi:hypothetical protein